MVKISVIWNMKNKNKWITYATQSHYSLPHTVKYESASFKIQHLEFIFFFGTLACENTQLQLRAIPGQYLGEGEGGGVQMTMLGHHHQNFT